MKVSEPAFNEFQVREDDMNYDTWISTDTLGDDLDGDSRQEQRLDEEARDLRWQAFMDWARKEPLAITLHYVAEWADGANAAWWSDADGRLRDFAETEGWSGVLQALAQIQKERETKAA